MGNTKYIHKNRWGLYQIYLRRIKYFRFLEKSNSSCQITNWVKQISTLKLRGISIHAIIFRLQLGYNQSGAHKLKPSNNSYCSANHHSRNKRRCRCIQAINHSVFSYLPLFLQKRSTLQDGIFIIIAIIIFRSTSNEYGKTTI